MRFSRPLHVIHQAAKVKTRYRAYAPVGKGARSWADETSDDHRTVVRHRVATVRQTMLRQSTGADAVDAAQLA